jgi:transposase-like protein
MTAELTLPKTLVEAIRYFSDADRCLITAMVFVWPDGVVCPHCKAKEAHFIATRKIWRCIFCKKQFSIKVGTIFADSPLGLDKWLTAIWLIANAKNGVSSYELHRSIGVTQKSAWFMLHRIRLAMKTGTFRKLSGVVESDETFIGGLEKNKHEDKKLHAGRGPVGKIAVMGLKERGGELRAFVIDNTKRETLHGEIKKQVIPGTLMVTDAFPAYRGLTPEYYHLFVDHAVKYVEGGVHTNGLENFWCLLKRTIKGTYTYCSPQHFERYLDEQVCRYNACKDTDLQRFTAALGQIAGRNLTYEQLTHGHLTLYGKV